MKRRREKTRGERFELRLSAKEKALANEAAARRGITVAAWLRGIMQNEFSHAR